VTERQILAFGGYPGDERLTDFLLSLTGKGRPNVCFLPTATGDSVFGIASFYDTFARRAEATCLELHGAPPADLRGLLLGQDVIYVAGGNTANMLAVWRVHGVDAILQEAWERGIVLSGWSAGAICWFEASVTDSFGPLTGLRDGLGFLAGSACPHYDGEAERRPTFTRLVAEGFPGGVAIDDDVGVRFVGTELTEVLTCREGATAYRVELRDGEIVETPLPARLLATA
jgi:dipeptidase E